MKTSIMNDYSELLFDCFEQRLGEYKEDKKGLGKNLVLAREALWMAVGDSNDDIANRKELQAVAENIQWFTGRIYDVFAELATEYPNKVGHTRGQYNIARVYFWKTISLVNHEAGVNGGFHRPKAGRPRLLVNDS